MPENLGFIGLGSMGEPIAANLLAAGYALRVYNRTAAKAAHLAARGATAAPTAAEVASPGGIVLTMLSDDRALETVCLSQPSFVEKLGPGGIHVSLSTISPATARRLAEHHARHKVAYVASPVFGRPDAAVAKRLAIPFSGPAAAKKRIEPILAAISASHFDYGEDPGCANVVKLCGNFLVASAIESLAETLTLAEKNGVDKIALAEMLGKTLFACPVYQGYGKQIAEQRFEPPGFKLALGLKDINLVLETAAAASTPMPLASLLHDRWLSAVAKGRQDADWAAVSIGVREDAGLK
jgi:3-hydroxyisobutyrate dehydrogenase-like beta-hydroxyacid dehydrogenase